VILSIRVKILALILSALLLSLVTNLVAGRRLILNDKSSYVYDYNLSIVREIETNMTAQIDQLRTASQSIAMVFGTAPNSGDLVSHFYEQNRAILPPGGFLIARPQSRTEFEPPMSVPSGISGGVSGLQAIFTSENWRPSDFELGAVLAGPAVDGKIPLGFRATDGTGHPIVIFSMLEIRQSLLQEYGKKMRIELLSSGKELAHFGFDYPAEKSAELEKFRTEIFGKPFATGAQEVKLGQTDYLASYAKIQNVPIMIVGLISKEASFEAAEQLVRQSVLLGLGILFLAISGTLLFSKGITNRLRQLWLATQKVSSGDFETHVPVGRGHDEITDLSASFNTMSGRIHALMKETAQKARMETELETAQAVQNRFFPSSDFESSKLRVSGMAIPATECGGDWWQYREIGPFLLIAIGDVTGHGVSSALVTAAAHGAFTVLLRKYEAEFSSSGKRPDLGELMKGLNEAVCAAGGEDVGMTMLLSMIDTRTGEVESCNASHRPAYLYRPDPTHLRDLSQVVQAFQIIQGSKIPQLGMSKELSVETYTFQLHPKDLIVWYTDGLVECENPDGKPFRKTDLLKLIASLRETQQSGPPDGVSGARQICQGLIDGFKNFLGSKIDNPEDDTTIVVAVISDDAQFLRKAG
jgi:sigma-B regulation protein RsbU (phosphoserine phosphatase)